MLARSLRIAIAVLTATITSTTLAQIDPESGDVYVSPEEGGTVPLEGGTGTVIDLQVTSTPEGAQVIADRQVIGVTPLDTQVPISNPNARMRVTVQHPGYQPHTFEVDPNRPSHSVHAALVPIGEPVAEGGEAGGGGGMSLEYGRRPRHEIRGALLFYTINNDNPNKLTELMLDLAGRFRLMGDDEENALTLDIEAQWSGYVAFFGDADPEARPNNPNVFVTLGSRFGLLRLWGGLGLALPIAAAVDDSGFTGGALIGLIGRPISGAMRGFIEPWNYQTSHIGIHARGGLEARFENGSVGAEMAFGGMPGIEANYSMVPTYFGWQLRLFGEARPIDLLSFGGQFGIVYLKDLDNGFGIDDVFVSLEPFVRFHFGPAFVGARFLLNFTDTFLGGFSFDDNGVWSLSVEGGVALE